MGPSDVRVWTMFIRTGTLWIRNGFNRIDSILIDVGETSIKSYVTDWYRRYIYMHMVPRPVYSATNLADMMATDALAPCHSKVAKLVILFVDMHRIHRLATV